jgi:hypothetical protein
MINCPEVGEESITDYLLWKWEELNKRIKFANLTKFSRYQENRISGADFEMELWIVQGLKGIPMLVQAKKMVEDYDGYCGKLNYFPDKSDKRQIDLLIEYSHRRKALPFYLFYALLSSNTRLKCEGYMWQQRETCLILADAYSILRIAEDCISKKGKHLSKDAILKEGNPFCCLFCCPLSYTGSNNLLPSLEGLRKYLDKYYPEVRRKEEFIFSEVPNYVVSLLKEEFTFEIFEDDLIRFDEETREKRILFRNLVVVQLSES